MNMNHLTALALKALINGGILLVLLPLAGRVLVGAGITVGVFLVVVAYLLVDLWVLPQFGNVSAVVADFGLALGTFVVATMVFPRAFPITIPGALLVAAAMAAGEWGFHGLLERRRVGAGAGAGEGDRPE